MENVVHIWPDVTITMNKHRKEKVTAGRTKSRGTGP